MRHLPLKFLMANIKLNPLRWLFESPFFILKWILFCNCMSIVIIDAKRIRLRAIDAV